MRDEAVASGERTCGSSERRHQHDSGSAADSADGSHGAQGCEEHRGRRQRKGRGGKVHDRGEYRGLAWQRKAPPLVFWTATSTARRCPSCWASISSRESVNNRMIPQESAGIRFMSMGLLVKSDQPLDLARTDGASRPAAVPVRCGVGQSGLPHRRSSSRYRRHPSDAGATGAVDRRRNCFDAAGCGPSASP